MRKAITAASIALAAVVAGGELGGSRASGPLGIFGIIERVHFYPDEEHAERIQMWGAFVYQACPSGRRDTVANPRGTLTTVERGYMYFTRPVNATSRVFEQLQREWLYIKSVAGTGQAIGFGSGWCGYVGRPSASGQPFVMESDGRHDGIRVRPRSEALAAPAEYPINIGTVPLNRDGTNADIVQQLEAARGK